MNPDIKSQTEEFIKTHPKMSFDKFKTISDIKINECYYYGIRRNIFPRGLRANSVSKTCVYVNVASIPCEKFSSETKKAITDLIKAINDSKGTKMEAIENVRDKTIEVRQVGV